MAGKLVVIEGMDGAGTTTQSKMLATHLSRVGYKVLSSAEPTGSPIGQEIRNILAMPIANEPNLLTMLALCFAADRMYHVHYTLIPGLKQHDFVILDRYVLSSLVYQGLHLPTSFVKEINQYAIKPDLTVILDLDAQEAHERLSQRAATKDFYEAPGLLGKLRSRYLHFAKDDPARTVLIDAQGSIDRVHSHLVHVIEEKFIHD